MSPANFQLRSRSKRRFLVPIVVGLLAVAGVLVYIGSRGGVTPTPKPSESQPLTFAFASTAFKPVFETKAPPAATIAAERRALETMFTAYYRNTFVDPSAWTDRTFASQQAIFTPEARAAFARDVGALTIGDGATDVTKVTPGVTSLSTSVYFDGKSVPTYAVAAVVFRATAETKSGQRIDIVQKGTYRLQKQGSAWVVFSYEADSKQDTPPSPSPSPSGSPS